MVPLIVVQPVLIDVMQEKSDIMYFGRVKIPALDLQLGCAALEGLFGPSWFPLNFTPIRMVQDIFDDIGVNVEVLTLRLMIEGGTNTISSGYIGL